jgi:hypothetical protein
LTLTFVLGLATDFTSGLGSTVGTETGTDVLIVTAAAFLAVAFATIFAACFRAADFTTFFAFMLFGFLSNFFFFALAFDFFFVAIVLTHFLQNCLMESFPHTLKRDALHDRIEETFDHDPFRVLLWYPARLEIEDRFLLQLPNRGTMRTADIIGQNFEAGYRIRA